MQHGIVLVRAQRTTAVFRYNADPIMRWGACSLKLCCSVSSQLESKVTVAIYSFVYGEKKVAL